MNDIYNYFFKTNNWTNGIDPNVVPPPKRELHWYEYTETRNKVNSIFFALGTVSGVAAILTPIYFTATLLTTLVVTSLALGAIALLIGAVYLSKMKPSELDPVYRLEKRQALVAESEVPAFWKLSSAQRGDILTGNEVQMVLSHDINQMNYISFIQKHGIDVLRSLRHDNLLNLKPSYLLHLSSFMNQDDENLNFILNFKESRIFGLTADELKNFLQEKERLKKEGNTSFLQSAANITLNVAKKVVPTSIMNTAQCASASILYATKGEFKKSALAGMGAVTSATLLATDKLLEAENPEAYHMSKQMAKYGRSNTQ